MCNDSKVLLPNYKIVGQTQTELHSLKVEKLDTCIRPPFCKFGHKFENPVSKLSWNFVPQKFSPKWLLIVNGYFLH